MHVNHASVNRSVSSTGPQPVEDHALATSGPPERSAGGSGSRANSAAWLLVIAFVVLVLSVAVPAMSHGDRADLAALLFMVGLAAALVGTAMAIVASTAKGRAVLGALVLLAGVVLMYGFVPSLAALGVVLVGAALQIGSLPAD
jgi:hypothetical protein